MTHDLQRTRAGRITIVQGEHTVTDDPDAVICTILGSCVAACMRDPAAGIGGMNHFLLPGTLPGAHARLSATTLRDGVHAMEMLVNGLLRRGAQRGRLECKLFGGARMMQGLTDVGELNASFAEGFLQAEGIALVGGSLRGERGRRIEYWPATGRARQVLLQNERLPTPPPRRPTPPATDTSGTLELF